MRSLHISATWQFAVVLASRDPVYAAKWIGKTSRTKRNFIGTQCTKWRTYLWTGGGCGCSCGTRPARAASARSFARTRAAPRACCSSMTSPTSGPSTASTVGAEKSKRYRPRPVPNLENETGPERQPLLDVVCPYPKREFGQHCLCWYEFDSICGCFKQSTVSDWWCAIDNWSRVGWRIVPWYGLDWRLFGFACLFFAILQHAPGVPKVLVGNRLHLEFKRAVGVAQAEAYAQRHGMAFFEISPLCNYNVAESLAELSRRALRRNGMERLWRTNRGTFMAGVLVIDRDKCIDLWSVTGYLTVNFKHFTPGRSIIRSIES